MATAMRTQLALLAVLFVPSFLSAYSTPVDGDIPTHLEVQEQLQHVLSDVRSDSSGAQAHGTLRRFPVTGESSDEGERILQLALEHDLDVWHVSPSSIDIYNPPPTEQAQNAEYQFPEPLLGLPHTTEQIPIPSPLSLPRSRLSSPVHISHSFLPADDQWNLTLGLANTSFHNTYHPLFEIDAFVHALAALHPNYTRIVSVGHSAMGREMWALSIGAFGGPPPVEGPENSSVNAAGDAVLRGCNKEEEDEETFDTLLETKIKKKKKKGGKKNRPKPPPDAKLGFVVVGAQHAREWIATATSLYLAHALLADQSEEHSLNKLLDVYDFHIVPVPNPDGYDYTWETDRFWYKNRQNFGPKTKCVGLDMNRNWGYKWKPAAGDVGSLLPSIATPNLDEPSLNSSNVVTPSKAYSTGSDLESKAAKKGKKPKKPSPPVDPCSHWYPGLRAFEAPETNNIANFVGSLENEQVVGFVDLRSYGQMLSAPYSYSCKRVPKDAEDQMEAALGATQALKTAYGTAFKTGTLCSMLYRAPGNILDWMYSRAGIKYSYVAHLRDTGTYGFSLPERWIRPVGEETANMVAYIAKFIAKKMNRPL